MKITSFILYTFLLLQTNNCFAQKDTSAARKFDRFYISLTGGMGIPVGGFAKFHSPYTSYPAFYSRNMAGEPRPGITEKLSGYYFFSPYLGCTGTFSTAAFKAKNKTLIEFTGRTEYDPYETQNFSYDVKSWTTNGFLIGMVVNAPLNKINLGFKILGGFQWAVSPETNVINFQSDAYHSFTSNMTQRSASSTNLAWDAGLDLRIKAYKKLNVILSVDYISSNATFSDFALLNGEYISIDPSGGYLVENIEISNPYEYKKQMSFFSLTAGIAYVFK